jgi:cell wall-associated NlpC family hydrolase
MDSSCARTVAAVVVALVVLPFAFLLTIPAIAAGSPTATDNICGPGGTGQSVANVALDAEQLANAATIATVTAGRSLPPYAATISLATAYQESTLHNITQAVDHDSLGLFQQRVIYYTAAVAADPVKATNAFLDRLVTQPNWQTRPLSDVAADIQQPLAAYRDRYAQWQPLAAQLTTQLWTGTGTPSTGTPSTGTPSTGTPSTGTLAAAPCAGSVGSNPGATPTHGPNGLTLTGSPAGNAAATYAIAQLGKPYVWGAQGPDAFDCSGLTMTAWASAGVTIPRVTYTQATAGTPVSIQDARTGDLVLIPGSDGTATNPGHVGMVSGTDTAGAVWLVEAARTGIPIRLTPMAGWTGQIVTIRRIG